MEKQNASWVLQGLQNVKVIKVSVENMKGMLKITLGKEDKRKLQPSNQNSNMFLRSRRSVLQLPTSLFDDLI